MSILAVGSIAFDSVETPFGRVDGALGGSANYFSVAASYFAPVRLVGVVGEDYPTKELEYLAARRIDLAGIKIAPGKTFHWKGKYGYNLNEAETLATCLNVFEDFRPQIPDSYRSSNFVFLGNIDPELQTSVLEQVDKPKAVICDTMNFWIRSKLRELKNTLAMVDILLINEAEARELSGEHNLVKAARVIGTLGPKVIVIKRGEYGVLLFDSGQILSLPAMPIEDVFDPTGAGDSFAGGFVGYLARNGEISHANYRKAVSYGIVMASFCVEDFSFNRLRELQNPDIDARLSAFNKLTDY